MVPASKSIPPDAHRVISKGKKGERRDLGKEVTIKLEQTLKSGLKIYTNKEFRIYLVQTVEQFMLQVISKNNGAINQQLVEANNWV